jgi:hypothetical protein
MGRNVVLPVVTSVFWFCLFHVEANK